MSASSSKSPYPHLATFEDLLAIPEEQRRHEILDGELVPKEFGGTGHSHVQSRANRWTGGFDGRSDGPNRPGGWWILTEVTIKLSMHQTVRPDIAGWRRERLPIMPNIYPIELRPDWICEVSGDGDARRRDGLQKRRIYADYGIPYYWIIDLQAESLTVLQLTGVAYLELLTARRGERVRPEPFTALELQVGTLFGDDTN